MPTVRAICTDALNELGVLGEAESMSGPQGALALLRAQNMFDAWAADQLTLTRQLRTPFTLTSGATFVTIGPAPADVVMVTPMFLNHATYIIPGSSPPVEMAGGLAIMNDAQYAAITIKQLSSALPTECFYQVNLDGVRGTLTFWPKVSQNVDIVIYTPEAVGIPVSLNTVLTGPAGYAEAFMYQLALRLCNPFGVQPSPLLIELAGQAMTTMKRPNVQPGLVAIDPALVLQPMGGRFNILTGTGG